MPGDRPLFIDLIAWPSSSRVMGASNECTASGGSFDKVSEFKNHYRYFPHNPPLMCIIFGKML